MVKTKVQLVVFVGLLATVVSSPLWVRPLLHVDAPMVTPFVPADVAFDVPAPATAVVLDPPAESVRTVPVDAVSPSIADLQARVIELEQENARLRVDLRTAQLASQLVMLSPTDRPLSVVDAMTLLAGCYLTETPELRMLFIEQARPDAMIDLLRAEPAFRAQLASLRADGTPEFRQFEWPAARDRLVSDFFRKLAEAGLSGKAIELYRVSLADYL